MILRYIPILLTSGLLFGYAHLRADGGGRLLPAGARTAVLEKIEQEQWAADIVGNLREEVDHYVAQEKETPHYVASRLFMHWQSRATTTLILARAWAGAEGTAPVPTPHFDGARDWATAYKPLPLDKLKPYNEQNGKLWMEKANGQGEWADPGKTGKLIGDTNTKIMRLAANAALLFWLTEDEAYAQMAADVLWTYVKGFSYTTPPRFLKIDRNGAKDLGATSFETIRDSVLPQIAITYSFLYPYLKTKQDYDVRLIQAQMKRMADRIIEGGQRTNNWNTKQNLLLLHAALALDDNNTFEDGKGRDYYIDIILNADLTNQEGIKATIANGFDKNTGVWPEPPGYSFDTTRDILYIACLLNAQKGEIMPLEKMVEMFFAQRAFLYPNYNAIGLGDTTQCRIDAGTAEILLSLAINEKNQAEIVKLANFIQNELNGGNYKRGQNKTWEALLYYIPNLKPYCSADGQGLALDRVSFVESLNVLIQRNVGRDSRHSLAAALMGNKARHTHMNGLAMELYGAGVILGADPGRGSSYWQPDHINYYYRAAAHNTVIPNGTIEEKQPMKIAMCEPTAGDPGVSPNISIMAGSIAYDKPGAKQKRLVATIRISDRNGFFLDIFRSKCENGENEYHDYLYHNIGNLLMMRDENNKYLKQERSSLLAAGDQSYQFFKNETSVDYNKNFRGTFTLKMDDSSSRAMEMWMLGSKNQRKLFSVNAPPCRAAADTLPYMLERPMPTVIVRQDGEAWDMPFVAIYEPKNKAIDLTSGVRSVQRIVMQEAASSTVGCKIEGRESSRNSYSVYLLNSEQRRQKQIVNDLFHFQGEFCAVINKDDLLDELYMVNSKELAFNHVKISAVEAPEINASLRRISPNNWAYSSTGVTDVSLIFRPVSKSTDYFSYKITLIAKDTAKHIDNVKWTTVLDNGGKSIWVASFSLPQTSDAIIRCTKSQ